MKQFLLNWLCTVIFVVHLLFQMVYTYSLVGTTHCTTFGWDILASMFIMIVGSGILGAAAAADLYKAYLRRR